MPVLMRLRACGFQRGESVPDIRIEPAAASIETREDRLAHPGIPEFADMFGDGRNGLVVSLVLEEFADLIGHIDPPVIMRHGKFRFLARPP